METIVIKKCKNHGETEFMLNSQNKYICKKCRSENVMNHRRDVKQKAVDYKGGKCEICGYDKCPQAFEFHHVNPEEKDIEYKKFKNRGWKRLTAELDKCILVCANCHREIHAGITDWL